MQKKWQVCLRKIHLYIGVFFSPLLLFFIITGWWQTVTPEEEREGDPFLSLMKKLSLVHTDDYFPYGAAEHHSHAAMKTFLVAMCVALILSICLGLWLAWSVPRNRWLTILAFVLGIFIPVLILYLA
jgi:ABC-type nitrate/sulfonate/bicarbonate transport system permease component